MILDISQTSKFLYGGAFAIVGKESVAGEAKTDASYALERPQITDKRLLSRFDPEFAPRIAP